jgi:hypothetical protein
MFTHYFATITKTGSLIVTTAKPLVFAALAGLPLAVFPAMARTNTPSSAESATESTRSTTAAMPPPGSPSGAYTATSQSEHLPMPTHADATGQTQGPIGGGASSGK